MSIPYEWHEIEVPKKGSDGVKRNLAEWYAFIRDSIYHIKDDTPLKEEVANAKWEVHYWLQCKEDGTDPDSEIGELTSYTGDAVFNFFRLAIKDAYQRGSSTQTRLDYLSDHMKSLAGKLANKTADKASDLGYALIFYIEDHGKLPEKPKDLEEFTVDDPRLTRIPRETVRDNLKYYKLENIVRGNNQG